MLKSAFPAALVLLALASSGCPIYDSNDGCRDNLDCGDGFVCDASTGTCVDASSGPATSSGACVQPQDCGSNETCSRSGTCIVGDCHYKSVGCVRGYSCSLETDNNSATASWMCVPNEGGEGGAPNSSDAGAAGASDAGAPAAAGGAPG